MPAQHAYKPFAITRLWFHNTLKTESDIIYISIVEEYRTRMRNSIIKDTNVIVENQTDKGNTVQWTRPWIKAYSAFYGLVISRCAF